MHERLASGLEFVDRSAQHTGHTEPGCSDHFPEAPTEAGTVAVIRVLANSSGKRSSTSLMKESKPPLSWR